MKIKFFTTGGTIDKVYFDAKSEFQVGQPQVVEVLEQAHVAFHYEVVPILKKDSLEITPGDRELIRKTVEVDPCERIIITHGTDTMAETAHLLLGIPKKTIVLTGAMEPAISRHSDADFNIGTAVAAVQALPNGVYIVMNGRIFHAENVRKNRAERKFEVIQSGDAFAASKG
ncbi:MAG: asparaginase domain-containing protein [Chloroherpetonaceae bacterium]|nr:asparaginase domain-containing protein [Chloroherpetonaceae bacterium]